MTLCLSAPPTDRPPHRAAHGLDPWATLSAAQAANGPRVKPVDSPVDGSVSQPEPTRPTHITKHPRTQPEGDKTSAVPKTLARSALGEDALQGAAVHVEAARGFRDIAITQLVNALNVLP